MNEASASGGRSTGEVPLPSAAEPDWSSTIFSDGPATRVDANGLVATLPLSRDGRKRLTPMRLFMKRSIDLLLASVALVIFAIPMLVIAVLVRRESPGAAFFVQSRPGRGGRLIPVVKFRTMYADRGDRSGTAHTRRNDERITPLGRWLRQTSVDELPQLLNVIAGHMSLVGPRPHPAVMLVEGEPYDKVVRHYSDRLLVRPGITGWAQVNGLRGAVLERAMAEARLQHDLAYIANLSIFLDLKIMVLTVMREFFSGHGA